MSRHLPAVSGPAAHSRAAASWVVVLRQKGSHVALEKKAAGRAWRTIVPRHREIRPGTLSDILNQSGLTKEDLMRLL